MTVGGAVVAATPAMALAGVAAVVTVMVAVPMAAVDIGLVEGDRGGEKTGVACARTGAPVDPGPPVLVANPPLWTKDVSGDEDRPPDAGEGDLPPTGEEESRDPDTVAPGRGVDVTWKPVCRTVMTGLLLVPGEATRRPARSRVATSGRGPTPSKTGGSVTATWGTGATSPPT